MRYYGKIHSRRHKVYGLRPATLGGMVSDIKSRMGLLGLRVYGDQDIDY